MNRLAIFWKVALVHIVFVLALMVFPLLGSCQWFKPDEQVIEIDLGSLPPLPPPEADQPEPDPDEEENVIPDATPVPTAVPTATPTPQPETEPTAVPAPTATPRPTATPKPAPTPTPSWKPVDAETIRQRMQEQQNQQPVPTRRQPTAAEIEAQIRGEFSTGGTGGSTSAGGGNGNGISIGTVKQELDARLNSAWTQPPGVSSSLGLTVDVSVRVEPNGRISATRILKASGHSAMDASVKHALSLVTQVRAFPSEYTGSGETFEYQFRIK